MTGFAERQLERAALQFPLRTYAPKPALGAQDVIELCRAALLAPHGRAPLRELAERARRIVIVLSDATRDEPRAELLTALLEHLPATHVGVRIAAGTHTADDRVVPQPFRHLPVTVHDSRAEDGWVELGTTQRGTRVRLPRQLVEADLVIATGRLRPHYFAGYSGGVKAVFPGCAQHDDIIQNHRLKAHPHARLGRLDDNPCRLDCEQAAAMLPGTLCMLNVLCDVDGQAVAAAAGHPVTAHRFLAAQATALFAVTVPRTKVVVVADRPPVTSTLYQASKLIPPAGAVLEPGGVVVCVAECELGTGPLERVNHGIFELGLKPQLPPGTRVVLVSGLDEPLCRQTYAEYAPDLTRALQQARAATGEQRPVVLWRAGELIAAEEP